jgi:hypothetical protein
MKKLLFLLVFLTASSLGQAQADLVGILFKGRVEYYWILYRSANGSVTKVSNVNSGIGFYIDTKYLASITVEQPIQLQRRVIRVARS